MSKAGPPRLHLSPPTIPPLDPTLPSWWGHDRVPPENWLTQFLEWLPPTLPFDDIPPYPRADVEDHLSRLK